MKKDLKDWIVPWLYSSREYNVGILDKAMDNPGNARLMLNENPIPPSEKVIEAVAESLRHGNWYPDSFLRLRTKIGKMYGLGPDNVALANGSSDTIDPTPGRALQCKGRSNSGQGRQPELRCGCNDQCHQ